MISTSERYNDCVHTESLKQVLERHESKSDIYFMLMPLRSSVHGRFFINRNVFHSHNMALKFNAEH